MSSSLSASTSAWLAASASASASASTSTSFSASLSSAAFATASASVSAVASASASAAWGDSPILGGVISNGTVLPIDDETAPEGNYAVNMLIGLLIILVASLVNALGLNVTKLDHVQQQSIPKRQRRQPWLRIMWLGGMGLYIASQLFGSPLALRYLRPDWVAPLGASSLVFNFLFARWLVGTPVTTADIRGTALIVLGVILILIFSSINHGLTQSLSISRLNSLWTRGSWIAYFIIIGVLTSVTYLFSDLLAQLVKSRASFSPLPSPSLELPTSRPKPPHPVRKALSTVVAGWRRAEKVMIGQLERVFARTDDARLTWLQGVGWTVTGGSLAGLCLVFTKAVVKIFSLPGHPLLHFSSIITLVLVVFTAVLQIVCLNKALQCADTVVVVPLFYAGYTVFGFINALIFYNETGQYAKWVLVAVFLSIAVLISGVVLLSLKPTSTGDETVSAENADPAMRMRPRTRGEGSISRLPKNTDDDGHEESRLRGPDDVLWEVGSASDGSDGEEEEGHKGVGGTRGGHGERGGLLMQGEDDDEAEGKGEGEGAEAGGVEGKEEVEDERLVLPRNTEQGVGVDADAEDEFGEFEAVSADDR